ncbi:OadG family protein [Methylotetracoccus oryzae]|uniref:OadG family protein n=1 Tax=Methylotetracoccus oryzae TaxID=1919059 RepID=UPI0013A52E21|nr:OadG family protein [Methylotetracoccus oryzae]
MAGKKTIIMEAPLAELLLSGVNLMLIGMGIVFSFLLLLVWIIQRTHGLLVRWEAKAAAPAEEPQLLANSGGPDNQAVVAAIIAAVHQHEHRTNGEN